MKKYWKPFETRMEIPTREYSKMRRGKVEVILQMGFLPPGEYRKLKFGLRNHNSFDFWCMGEVRVREDGSPFLPRGT